MQVDLTMTELEDIITSIRNEALVINEKMSEIEGTTDPSHSNQYNLLMDQLDAFDNLLEKLEERREVELNGRSTPISDQITSSSTHYR